MQNNTPFSRDLTPDLTRTILSVVKEGQAYSGDPPYSGVERRAKSGPNQRNTKGSSRTEYNHFEGEYRPSGEQDRFYAKQRAEAKAKAKKTTTVKEGQAYSGDPPYSGVDRRAKSGPNQRATPSDRRPTGSAETEYNYFHGEYRPRGEQDRFYAKHRAEAKAKKTTTVKEERGGSPEDGNTGYGLPRKNSRFYPAKNKRPTGPGTEYHMETLLKRYEAKKAAEKLSALKQNRLDSKSVKEEREYTELLETIIVAIANELNISPQTLIEEFSEQELSEGLRKKIMHGLKVATAAGALLAGTAGAAHQLAKPEWTTPRHHSPSSQVQKADSKTTQSTSAAKAKAKAKAKSSDYDYSGQILPGVDNSSLFSN